jgi:hypothetical protein
MLISQDTVIAVENTRQVRLELVFVVRMEGGASHGTFRSVETKDKYVDEKRKTIKT